MHASLCRSKFVHPIAVKSFRIFYGEKQNWSRNEWNELKRMTREKKILRIDALAPNSRRLRTTARTKQPTKQVSLNSFTSPFRCYSFVVLCRGLLSCFCSVEILSSKISDLTDRSRVVEIKRDIQNGVTKVWEIPCYSITPDTKCTNFRSNVRFFYGNNFRFVCRLISFRIIFIVLFTYFYIRFYSVCAVRLNQGSINRQWSVSSSSAREKKSSECRQ